MPVLEGLAGTIWISLPAHLQFGEPTLIAAPIMMFEDEMV